MTIDQWAPLAIWTITAIFVIASLWALFCDRPRERLRCRRCWYDLSAINTTKLPVTCPECGKRATKPQHLRKARRRYLLAIMTFSLAFLAPSWIGPAIQRYDEGWTAIIPSTALLIASSRYPDWHDPVQRLVRDRASSLSQWHIEHLLKPAARINCDVSAPLLITPGTFPRGMPIPVRTLGPQESTRGNYHFIIEPRHPLESNPWLRWIERNPANDPSIPPGFLKPCNQTECTYMLEVQRLALWMGTETHLDFVDLFTQQVTVRTTETRPSDAPHPITDNALIQSTFSKPRFSLVGYSDRAALTFDDWIDQRSTLLILQFDLLIDDNTIWSGICSNVYGIHELPGFESEPIQYHTNRISDRQRRIRADRISVHIRSRDDLTRYITGYDYYWSGEITRPFLDLFENNHPGYTIVPPRNRQAPVPNEESSTGTAPPTHR